jgi:FKBP-type peptidyl-prolyl cis-trans isomerase SlyD
MKNIFHSVTMMLALCWFSSIAFAQTNKAGETMVKNGATVSLEYTLTGDDGKVIESNKGKEPLRYVDGRSQIIPGLEKALVGMKAGTEKKVTVKPEDAYGQVDPKAYREVPKENVPADSQKPGMTLFAKNAEGEMFPVRVKEIKEKTVVIDMNHPLAGKTLVFDVKILDVQPPSAAQPSPPK